MVLSVFVLSAEGSVSDVVLTSGVGVASDGFSGEVVTVGTSIGAGLPPSSTGKSSNTVYSRTKRPLDQLTSTRKSRKGSRMGWLVVTLITWDRLIFV